MNRVFCLSGKSSLQAGLCTVILFLFIHRVSIAQQPGITWTSRVSAGNSTWTSVCYGNGKFVAVGANTGCPKCVMTSPDGINWSIQTAIPGVWSAISFGNGTFVAVADGGPNQVMTSPDGVNWTDHTPAAIDNAWKSITWGDPKGDGKGLFVAVTDVTSMDQVMISSDDGLTWTSHKSVVPDPWVTVTYGNGLFVAIAASNIYSGKVNQVMTSSDGINWSGHESTANNDWTSVAYGNNLFVAVAQNSSAGEQVMVSSDGSTWTAHKAATPDSWNSIAFGSGLFVAVSYSSLGAGNEVMTSPDGITWTGRTASANLIWESVTYANSLFVAVGQGGSSSAQVMTSGTFAAIPLHWLYVKGGLNNAKQASIEWQVVEQDVAGYTIEKSSDGINYITVGIIASKGNGENSYSFTEQRLLTSTAWYRLKQTDIDGKFSYSNIIVLRNRDNFPISVYPNPVEALATVLVDKKSLNKTALLTDMAGKTWQTTRINNLCFAINVAGYPTGCYLLKIENEIPVKIIKK